MLLETTVFIAAIILIACAIIVVSLGCVGIHAKGTRERRTKNNCCLIGGDFAFILRGSLYT
jgi:hypothetical protein